MVAVAPAPAGAAPMPARPARRWRPVLHPAAWPGNARAFPAGGPGRGSWRRRWRHAVGAGGAMDFYR
ncbi:hypothetical protein G6F57_021055 [Rhizopus arrhizus]|nr:hypothetical protein G6F31_019835 [Rhizopus arrhizus]KAG1386960.1 hypothetical protein G6F60_014296 [Rhizopus arrhizus]KAG1435595.1 hypothetical protein G6F57_021055 [Rhizopus arrhizus]